MNSLLAFLGTAGKTALPIFINFTWQSTLLISAVFFINRFIVKKQAIARHSLWLVAFLGCLILPLLNASTVRWRPGELAHQLYIRLTALRTTDSDNLYTDTSHVVEEYPTASFASSEGAEASWMIGSNEMPVLPSSEPNGFRQHWQGIFFVFWLLGAIFIGVRLLNSYLCIRDIRRKAEHETNTSCGWNSTPFGTEPILSNFYSLAQKMKVRRKVSLLISDCISVPVTAGIFSPAILLPKVLSQQLTGSEMKAVLAHELAHVKRNDYLVNLFQRVLQAVFFFHPLIHFAVRQANRECEHICDDWALSIMGESAIYAKSLAKLLDNCQNLSAKLRAAPAIFVRKSHIVQRIKLILNPEREPVTRLSWRAFGALVVVGCLLIAAVATSQVMETSRASSLIASNADASPEPKPAIAKEIKKGVYQIGNVIVDTNTGEVIAPGNINMAKGIIEYFACGKLGKTHESLMVLDIEPIYLQAALLKLGMTEGSNLRTPVDTHTPGGTPAEIWVEWELAGKRERRRAEDLIYNVKENKPMQHTNWVFTGARIVGNTFTAQAYKNMIATYLDPNAILNHPLEGGKDDTTYRVNSDVVPPVGTKAKVIIKPVKNREGTETIRGFIEDMATKNRIPGARVDYTGPKGISGSSHSGAKGEFEISGLVAGEYKLTVSQKGYITANHLRATIAAGRDAMMAVGMRKATGWLQLDGKGYAVAPHKDVLNIGQKDGFAIGLWFYLNRYPKRDECWVLIAKPDSYAIHITGAERYNALDYTKDKIADNEIALVWSALHVEPDGTKTLHSLSHKLVPDENIFSEKWYYVIMAEGKAPDLMPSLGGKHCSVFAFNDFMTFTRPKISEQPYEILDSSTHPVSIGGVDTRQIMSKGKLPLSPSGYFDGGIDGAHIYGHGFFPATGDDIVKFAYSDVDEGTVALWHFDDADGSTKFMDASKNKCTMYAKGAAKSVEPKGSE